MVSFLTLDMHNNNYTTKTNTPNHYQQSSNQSTFISLSYPISVSICYFVYGTEQLLSALFPLFLALSLSLSRGFRLVCPFSKYHVEDNRIVSVQMAYLMIYVLFLCSPNTWILSVLPCCILSCPVLSCPVLYEMDLLVVYSCWKVVV